MADRAPQLERLALDGILQESASAFAQFPKLRALDLRDVRFGATPSSTSRVFESFVAQRLPELRELSCPSPISANEIRPIVAAFGLQLDLLDARGEWEIEGIADDVQAQMAGELRVGPLYREYTWPLLSAGGTTREPWWGLAMVNSRLPS